MPSVTVGHSRLAVLTRCDDHLPLCEEMAKLRGRRSAPCRA